MKRILTIFFKFLSFKRKRKKKIGFAASDFYNSIRAYSYGKKNRRNECCHEIEFIIKIKPSQIVL